MSKIKNKVYGILKGGFLTNDEAFKKWRIIIFVVLLLLIMISSGHNADKKVILISDLNKLKRSLREEYVDTSSRLERMEMESNVNTRVQSFGLKPAKEPPKKIKVTFKEI